MLQVQQLLRNKDVNLMSDLPTVEKQQPSSCTDQLHLSSQLSDGWVPGVALGGAPASTHLTAQPELQFSFCVHPVIETGHWDPSEKHILISTINISDPALRIFTEFSFISHVQLIYMHI